MASEAEPVSLNTDALIEEAVAVAENAQAAESDIVSKAFTSVEEGSSEVQYVTMTPEEAAAAGVMEDEQVVTTSLQFDPANPDVLYTADGTPINQSDLSPEEQALVQAALQQHLAEQEAEQQLAMIDENATQDGEQQQMVTEAAGIPATDQPASNNAEPVATINSADPSVNLASPNTNASQIVQTLANNVRRQQEYLKAQNLLDQAKKQDGGAVYNRFEEKIVIRQGQPQVVKVPIKSNPSPKKPEIPAALANLMPKIEVGKDGSQVIRIHQSQITADQLKSLQENPNVRLVFRPANSSRAQSRPNIPGMPNSAVRKRGRPRKNFASPAITNHSYERVVNADGSPPSKTRYGRTPKQPYSMKDYTGDEDDGDYKPPSYSTYSRQNHVPGRRGRPPGSLNRVNVDRQAAAYRRANSYATKIEALREQEEMHSDDISNARLSITPQKPALSSVEQAISTRRKNRLRELLSACSEDEIMEVALPHLARVFSLWEFLIMKVEKNKLSRVYFADVYKEYEALHKYVCRLTDKYKETLATSSDPQAAENGEEELEKDKQSFVTIRCKKLAESLGLDQEELKDAMITLLDSEPIKPAPEAAKAQVKEITDTSTAVTSQAVSSQDANVDAAAQQPSQSIDPAKPVQTEATSTNSPATLVMQEPAAAEVTPQQEEQQPRELEASTAADSEGQKETAIVDSAAETAAAAVGGAESMQVDATTVVQDANGNNVGEGGEPLNEAEAVSMRHTVIAPCSTSSQIIQIDTGEEKQFIEVPEGYTLIQTPEGLVMSQPGTTLSQAEDGTIYVTQEDGTTTPLDSQKGVPLETVESLLSLEGQQQQQQQE